MTKLPDQSFRIYANDGKLQLFKTPTRVDPASGTFGIQIPEELEDQKFDLETESHMSIYGSRGKRWLQGPNLQLLKKAIETMLQRHVDVEITTTRVIVYRYATTARYWKTSEGLIYSNGHISGGEVRGSWQGSDESGHLDSTDLYSVGFIAKVLDMHESKRGTIVTRKFETPKVKDHFDHSDPIVRLNGFVHVHLEDVETMHRVPYTPEAAQRFYEIMIAMCMLADRLKRLGNPVDMAKILKAKNPFLLEAS